MRSPGVVGFHGFSEKLTMSGSTVTVSSFVTCVKKLISLGYSFSTLDQYKHRVDGDKSLFFYFDDCDLSIYNVITQELRDVDFVGTLFPISNYINSNGSFDVINKDRNLMRTEHIKELIDRGFAVGSHTATHIPLAVKKSRELWAQEVIESKEKLEELFNVEVKFLSAPFGNYSDELIAYLLENGYESLVTINGSVTKTKNAIVGHPAYNLDNSESLVQKSINGDNMFSMFNSFLYNQFSKGSVLLKS